MNIPLRDMCALLYLQANSIPDLIWSMYIKYLSTLILSNPKSMYQMFVFPKDENVLFFFQLFLRYMCNRELVVINELMYSMYALFVIIYVV